MSAVCKGGRNVHELFFPPCVRQGGKKSFEQKLSLSGGTAFLNATVHACGKRCKFPRIALQLIGRGSEQLLGATSVQVVFALLQAHRKTRSFSPLGCLPTSPDKKMYTLFQECGEVCTFFCPDLALCIHHERLHGWTHKSSHL